MAKAYKLDSGLWAIRPTYKGQRAFFTAERKDDVMLMASEWLANRKTSSDSSVTLRNAIKAYIDTSTDVLSPSTVRGYYIALDRLQDYDIIHKKLGRITAAELQRLVNTLARKYAPKTVKNTYALVTATFRFYGLPSPEGINLPKARPKSYNLPSDDDLRHLLELAEGTDMELVILLAAFGGLRRSEIAALSTDDIEGDAIHVREAVVRGVSGELHTKGTKTLSSDRLVLLPDFVMEKLKEKDGMICPMSPAAITRRWERLRAKVGVETRLHDLRHYSASLMHAIGVPDQYIMGRHGWKTDYALKTIYRNEIDDVTRAMNDKVNRYFDRNFGEKCQWNVNEHGKVLNFRA